MRILMIAPQPFFSPRGTPFSVYYRLLSLSELGHEVDLITYHLGDNIAIPGLSIHRACALPWVRKIKIGPSLLKIVLDFFLFIKLFMVYVANHKSYDLMYVHEEALVFGVIFKTIFGKRYIYDMHSSLPQQFENFKYFNWRWVKAFFAWVESVGINNASYVITICDDLDVMVRAYGYQKTELIQNTRFDPIEYEIARNEVIPTTVMRMLHEGYTFYYSGTFEQYQGMDLLLEAFVHAHMRDDSLRLILSGGDSVQVEKYRLLATDLGVATVVLFTGILSPNCVKLIAEKADALLSTRVSGTNTPLKVYELLASGKPIIATRIYSHTQVLSDKTAFLAEPNPHALADTLCRCAADQIHAEEKSKYAVAEYDDKYTKTIYLDKLKIVLAGATA